MALTLFLFVLTFFVTTLFGYIMHWMLHQKWFGMFNKSHMIHHMKLYPIIDFFSVKYRRAGRDSTVLFFLVAGCPLVILPIVLYLLGKIGLIAAILVAVEAITIGLLNNWFHDSFHITDHWLNKFNWFKNLIKLHQEHHIDMRVNYGIFTFTFDKFFGTFKK